MRSAPFKHHCPAHGQAVSHSSCCCHIPTAGVLWLPRHLRLLHPPTMLSISPSRGSRPKQPAMMASVCPSTACM